MWHDPGRMRAFDPSMRRWLQAWEHYESPETKRRLNNLLEYVDFSEELVPLKPRAANFEQVTRFHTPEYFEKIREMSEADGGEAGEGATFSHGGFEIALLAAGGTITAVDAVLDREIDNAYALVRPPGHHAERDRGRGFCIFGNVAIAGMHALADRGLARIATLDWDVHHGNGTQQAFYDRNDALTISIHQEQWYPRDSGTMQETGEDDGDGYNINIPLPPGSGHGAYVATIEQVVVPAAASVQAGPDPGALGIRRRHVRPAGPDDGLQRDVPRDDRAALGRRPTSSARGRLVLSHEGGYSPTYVPFCGLAVVEELSGKTSGAADPMGDNAAGAGGQDLQPHQQARISEAATMVDRLRSLEGLS